MSVRPRHAVRLAAISLLLVTPLAAQAVPLPPPPAAAFPLQAGEVVATYCPNDRSSNGNSVILVDPRTPGPIGSNWLAPFFSNETGAVAERWNYSNLGCVFGVATDLRPNIYVTASSSYGDFGIFSASLGGTYGPAGGGGVYRIDGVTGNIDSWMVTGSGAVNTNTLYNPMIAGNTPAGLGDICYDSKWDQFFVSDFADGRIYQVKNGTGALAGKGVVQGVYDPFLPFPYAGNPLFAPLGERVWAVHVTTLWKYSKRPGATFRRALLFSVWLRDRGPGPAGDVARQTTPWPASWPANLGPNSDNNAIFEWDLDFQGNPVSSGPTLWAIMPTLDGQTYSSPVSDITTSVQTPKPSRVYVAERTMVGDYGALGNGHLARVLQFKLVFKLVTSFTWPPPPDPDLHAYQVGDYPSDGPGWNSCGGIAAWLRSTHLTSLGYLWSTGDALLDYIAGNYVYGLQGIPGDGNQNLTAPKSSTSLLIDLDHDISVPDKAEPGDVEYVPRNAH